MNRRQFFAAAAATAATTAAARVRLASTPDPNIRMVNVDCPECGEDLGFGRDEKGKIVGYRRFEDIEPLDELPADWVGEPYVNDCERITCGCGHRWSVTADSDGEGGYVYVSFEVLPNGEIVEV